MAAMSAAAMTVLGSAMAAAPATTLSSSAAFESSRAQQLVALRSPASLNASRIVTVRASNSSDHEDQRSPAKSKALGALVAAAAAFASNVTGSGSAKALDLNGLIDNVVRQLSRNRASGDDDDDDGMKNGAVEVAKQAVQRVASNAARDYTSGDRESQTRRLVESVTELVSNLPSLEGNREAKDAAIDITQSAAHDPPGDAPGNAPGNLLQTVTSLAGKIPGLNGEQAVDMAKGAAQGTASNSVRDFAARARNRIGQEAGKALWSKLTGTGNNEK